MEMEVLLADPAKDHWANPAHCVREQDIDAHRQVYVGVHMPSTTMKSTTQYCQARRSSGVRPKQNRQYQISQRKKKQLVVMTKHTDDSASEDEGRTMPAASERVRFILGSVNEKGESDVTYGRHELFTELEEFVTYEDGDEEWKETARWFRYEEDVEEGSDRWSKPHVATLSLHSLFEVRSCLMSGTVMLDMEAESLAQVADLVLDHLISCNRLEESARMKVRDALLRRHRHQRSEGLRKGLSNIIGNRGKSSLPSVNGQRKTSSFSLTGGDKSMENDVDTAMVNGKKKDALPAINVISESEHTQSPNIRKNFNRSASVPGHLVYQERNQPAQEDVSEKLSGFMKKLPPNSEASNVLVGEVDFLIKPITAFIRLHKGVILGDLTEAPIPTRFLFIMMGPAICPGKYHEIGRSISTLMADEVFHEVAYLAKKRDDLIAGIDEFLEKVTVLPPGEWDPSIRIQPPPETPTNESRRQNIADSKKLNDNQSLTGMRTTGNSSDTNDEEDGLTARYFTKTKEFFGGLKQDFKSYKDRMNDVTDAFNSQCIGCICFTYILILAMITIYGKLYKQYTDSYLSEREHLLSLAINGILHSLFSGQPLVILGFTFPLVIFDAALYKICQLTDLDFLSFRMWVGIWTVIFMLMLIAFSVSIYIRYFTRFTLEIYIVVVALVVLYNTFSCVDDIRRQSPVSAQYSHDNNCLCVVHATKAINASAAPVLAINTSSNNATQSKHLGALISDCVRSGGVLVGTSCNNGVYFLSIILTLLSVLLVSALAMLRMGGYFPAIFRRMTGDFATLITVILMSMLAFSYRNQVNILYVNFPGTFAPAEPKRSSWMVKALAGNPLWTILVACIPAIFLTMTLFIEQHLTALIVNRRESKLKKRYGYHLDLLLITIGLLVSSIFGLPFTAGSAVISVSHIQSLYIDCTEYQRNKVKGVREQRVTAIAVFVLVAISPVMSSALKYIPQTVLFGVMIFAGVRILNNVEFIERLKVMAMPKKKQPDLLCLRQVPTLNVYLYTIIQLFCILVLWAIRMTYAAVIFPVAMVLTMLLRFLLSKIFRTHHLVVLDEAIPKNIWQQKLLLVKEQLLKDLEKGEETDDDIQSDCVSDFFKCEPPSRVVISEELVKMPVWQNLIKEESSPQNSAKNSPKASDNNRKKRRRHTRKKVTDQSKSSTPNHEEELLNEQTSKEDEIKLPAPWDLPYQSPPRTDLKFLTIDDYEVNIDPACSRNESKSEETTKSDEVYSLS
eukprot:gene18297-20120_t